MLLYFWFFETIRPSSFSLKGESMGFLSSLSGAGGYDTAILILGLIEENIQKNEDKPEVLRVLQQLATEVREITNRRRDDMND